MPIRSGRAERGRWAPVEEEWEEEEKGDDDDEDDG